MIIGTNDEEGALLGPDARTEGLFPRLPKEDQSQLAKLYGPQASNDTSLARLEFRDGYFASEARWIASKVSAAGAPAYLYRFEYVLGVLQARRTGAFHGSEVPFVFDSLPTKRVDENDLRVVRAVHGCWAAFARTGKPTCADAADWPAFGGQENQEVGTKDQAKKGEAHANTGHADGGEVNKWMVFDAHPGARPVDGTAALDLLQCRLADASLIGSSPCPPK
ncbi:MAG: hypothetical protein JWL65_933 [Gammaproteobacteria bacterium]|nr:hypothetical protein [Gammaproteobacteria bacterium]